MAPFGTEQIDPIPRPPAIFQIEQFASLSPNPLLRSVQSASLLHCSAQQQCYCRLHQAVLGSFRAKLSHP